MYVPALEWMLRPMTSTTSSNSNSNSANSTIPPRIQAALLGTIGRPFA